MKKRVMAWLLAVLMAAALCGCGGSDKDGDAQADQAAEDAEQEEKTFNWAPDSTVTVIVAYPAGDINDITARVLGQYAEKYIGQRIEIVNRPGGVPELSEEGEPVEMGGAGAAGWAELADSTPDGLTIGYVDLPSFCQSLARGHGYFTQRDFTPICSQEMNTSLVVARANDTRFTTLKDLVEVAKAQADAPLVAATDGEGGFSHICTQAFARSAGFTYATTHLSRAAEALQALRTSKADFCVVDMGDMVGQDSGLRVLGVYGEERVKEYPDVPTLDEDGYCSQWLGTSVCIVAPAGVKQDVVDFYEDAFRQAMADPGYKAASTGIATGYLNAEDTAALMAQQLLFTQGTAKHFW